MRRLISLFLLPLLAGGTIANAADDEVNLVDLMARMQYFTHKLQLSLDHGNGRLADFYAHELEEVIEETMEVPAYHDSPIGKLTRTMLLPAFEQLEAAIERDATAASRQFDALLTACNACHQVTNHGYIVVSRNPLNPYLQNFEPRE